jgi:DNA-binding SARP family transcriptional activator
VTYKILGEDALWESAYRAQMSIFYEMGKPSMVREVFKQAQDVFHQQMDSDLSPATEELYESLLSEANPA